MGYVAVFIIFSAHFYKIFIIHNKITFLCSGNLSTGLSVNSLECSIYKAITITRMKALSKSFGFPSTK